MTLTRLPAFQLGSWPFGVQQTFVYEKGICFPIRT